MNIRSRLIFLFLAIIVLFAVAWFVIGKISLNAILGEFWFTSGLFLLLLLSLVDQPYFSKDSNILGNAATAWISLLLVETPSRDYIWGSFFGLSTYLIIVSVLLMWERSSALKSESSFVQLISRINRIIGSPDCLFSAFFLWGALKRFGINSGEFQLLFALWGIFMILNLPSVSNTLERIFSFKLFKVLDGDGRLVSIISPRIAEVLFSPDLPLNLAGHVVNIKTGKNKVVGSGVIVDDRIVAGKRIGRLAITKTDNLWGEIGSVPSGTVKIYLDETAKTTPNPLPISVVDVGSEIGKMVFHVHPNQSLQSGEVLWAQRDSGSKAFYQIISAVVCQQPLSEGNFMHTVKVTAGQLGVWDEKRMRFEPITWVAPAGELIYKAQKSSANDHKIPEEHVTVGNIPNSDFPVHVSIQDVITHNTAVIGVTGSGKSYLAFHLIEAMIKNGIKVLILDISRQHDLHLAQHNPTALRTSADVKPWIESESLVGIHQFGTASEGYPKSTADFVRAAFTKMAETPLVRGKNIPAKLCIVFEEAHSLIPEWNQVAQEGDKAQVNKTSSVILQGRKYGMGALIITQRTANVTKTILNQCNTIFALQSFDQTGLDFLRNYMGEEYSQAISTLPARHAILVGKASSSARPVLLLVNDMAGRWEQQTGPDSSANKAANPLPATVPVTNVE